MVGHGPLEAVVLVRIQAREFFESKFMPKDRSFFI